MARERERDVERKGEEKRHSDQCIVKGKTFPLFFVSLQSVHILKLC